MKDQIQLLDIVVLTQDLPEDRLRKGTIGTVVEKFSDDDFLVEFADQEGKAYAFEELTAEQLLKVYYAPVQV